VFALVVTLSSAIGLAVPLDARPRQRDGAATANGAELFKTYCASCHGATGTGHGPAAVALRHEPPDLTLLAKKNGGMFPAARVRRIVEGRDVDSHGDRDMPIWGDAFRPTHEGRTQDLADARIALIVRFLDSIQQRQAQ
jgi:mono/diheme cytochrome c family protein